MHTSRPGAPLSLKRLISATGTGNSPCLNFRTVIHIYRDAEEASEEESEEEEEEPQDLTAKQRQLIERQIQAQNQVSSPSKPEESADPSKEPGPDAKQIDLMSAVQMEDEEIDLDDI